MARKIFTYVMLVVAYLILAAPFKVMEIIPGFTDIRPVMMLGPLYALFYGVPGCIIFALMNLVMDIAAGDIAWSCIPGLISNFVGPYLIMYYWKKMASEEPHLRTMKNIGKYSLVVILTAILEAAIITPSVASFYPDVNWKVFFLTVTLNTSLFPILFGIPLTILIQEELGFKQIPSKS